MPLAAGALASDQATRNDVGIIGGDDAGNYFRGCVLADEHGTGAEIHFRILATVHDCLEHHAAIVAVEVRDWVRLDRVYWFQHDVIVDERCIILEHNRGPRAHFHLLLPLVDHRERDLGIFLHVEFRDALVHGPADATMGDATRDDVDFRAFLGDDHVVHDLPRVP